MKIYNKLVRDNIPEIITKSGAVANTRVLNEEEYLKYLLEKLQEEVKELIEQPSKEELADILEVVRAIATKLQLTIEEVEIERVRKAKSNGAFKKRIFLESTE